MNRQGQWGPDGAGMGANLDPALESTREEQTSPGLREGMESDRNFLSSQTKDRALGPVPTLNPSASWALSLWPWLFGPRPPSSLAQCSLT